MRGMCRWLVWILVAGCGGGGPGKTTTTGGTNGGGGVVAGVSISPAGAAVAIGHTLALTAVAVDASGTAVTPRGVFMWSTSDSTIANVNPGSGGNAELDGVAGGTVTITATADGVSGSADYTVATPLAAVTVSPLTVPIMLSDCPSTVGLSITNSGDSGSTLSWALADGGGYLQYEMTQNMATPLDTFMGTLGGGGQTLAFFSVKSQFLTPFTPGGPISADGITTTVGVDTNVGTINVSVPVLGASSLVGDAGGAGSWNGTWTAMAGYNGMTASAPGGTWSLAIASIDASNSTCTGTLTLAGTDVYWEYDGMGMNVSQVQFQLNDSIAFDDTQCTVAPPTPTPQWLCGGYTLDVEITDSSGYQISFGPVLDPAARLVHSGPSYVKVTNSHGFGSPSQLTLTGTQQ